MDDYIFLKRDNKSVFFKYIKNANVKKYYLIKETNIIFKILKKINMINLVYGFWKFNIKNYKYIVLGENGYYSEVSKYIKKKNKNCKIILYFWNPITNYYLKLLDDKNIDEFCTFDKNDAQKYNLRFNGQFYTKDIVLQKNKEEFDVLFLGWAKDRKKILLDFELKLNMLGLKTKFIIIEAVKDFIDYDVYLDLISKSKCILDVNQEDQIGLTLRPMESLFFDKKLITNNKDIKNYDFYNKENIFILGEDDESILESFINSKYIKVDSKIKNYYDYNEWLSRIINN